MIQAFLVSLMPDKERLLSDLSKHITDEMLADVALADHGQDQDKHLAALLSLRDVGVFREPMYLYPCEVLELVRSSQPNGEAELQGHWVRAFACAGLLRAKEEPWNYGGDAGATSFTLIQLIRSIQALPIDFTHQCVGVLAWIMSHADLEGKDEQIIYCGVGLLWLALHLGTQPADRDLIELSAWIARREAEIHSARPWAFDRWLLGIGHDPPPSPWESLGQELSELELDQHQQELRDWVKLIGGELSGKGLG